MKRMISASDPRLKDKDRAAPKKQKKDDDKIKTTEAPATSSALFFQVTDMVSLLIMRTTRRCSGELRYTQYDI